MNLGLKNRVALVAASSQGLGLATAQAFAAEGCRVAMCARNKPTLEAAADKIRKHHNVEVFAEACDVGDSAAVARFVPPEEFADYGALARAKGFMQVAATPLTRSSYHADADFAAMRATRAARLAA